MSSSEGSNVIWPMVNFPFVDLNDYDFVSYKALYPHKRNNGKTKNKDRWTKAESQESQKKNDFIFMTDLMFLIHKTSVYPIFQHMKKCLRNNQIEQATEKVDGFQWIRWRFRFNVCGPQKCHYLRVKEASAGSITPRSFWLDEKISRKQQILVVRDEKIFWEEV